MRPDWERLEGQVVNGAFPLQRCIGSTDRSGVYLTQATRHAPSAVALKLVAFARESAELLRSRWRAAARVTHPDLARIFEVGECRLDGQEFLYLRTEFAEQTLAQVLERRALTEDEAREMLSMVLGVLQSLHREDLVHAGLTPSNVLVMRNRLKLTSDTLRAIRDDDPECSTAADIRALGVTLCEALTRMRPVGLEVAGDVALPSGLLEPFHAIVSRCVARDPADRPTVAVLQTWALGEAPPAAPAPPAVPGPASAAASARATRLVIRVELPSNAEPPSAVVPERASRRMLPWALGACVLAAAGVVGNGMFATDPARTDSPAIIAVLPTAMGTPSPIDAVPPSEDVAPRTAAPATPVPPPAAVPGPIGMPALEVLPVISASALDTIKGTVRVTVRVTVDGNGTVIAATPQERGPSRYFERQSLAASRKWTFGSAGAQQRSMLLRFNYSRSGVTATAERVPSP